MTHHSQTGIPVCFSFARLLEMLRCDTMHHDKPLLKVSGLGITLDGNVILNNISFSVGSGELIALVGPNGSGKSVLLRALMGLMPYSGTITWAPKVRMGYVPQSLTVDRTLPMTGNEFFGAKGISKSQAAKLVAAVGMERAVLRQRLGHLSGGQLQRLLIAWAVANDPKVILFDEPTSGVDAGGQESVYELLDRLRQERGLAVLLVSHDLNVVYARADHVLCINRDLVCHGPPHQVLDTAMLKRLYGNSVGVYAHQEHHGH